ncbi:hypothetical protein AB0L40_05275 [Patulibacter sp. NPDC049589]|uniref:hypothetical protein n=1 Tax=Patulibacter sp. NPDC049589 TaxID=3154731 RepID=UPI003424A836
MIAWLRGIAARPIHDAGRTFAVAALLLVLITIVLVSLTRTPDRERAVRATPRVDVPVVVPAAPTSTVPADEQRATRTPERVEVVVREFLGGYLAALYGHGTAGRIHHATAGLRKRLARRPFRVSPATRRRHPMIQRLTITPVGRGSRWRAVATVADGGVATYPIGLTLTRTTRGVAVSDLLEDE